jgi:hypothetical protein
MFKPWLKDIRHKEQRRSDSHPNHPTTTLKAFVCEEEYEFSEQGEEFCEQDT